MGTFCFIFKGTSLYFKFLYNFFLAFESASDAIKDGTLELRKDIDKLEKTLSQKLKEAQESFSEKLEDAKQTFSEKLEDAKQTFGEKLEDAQQTFGEKLEDAQQNLSEKLSEVQENANSFQHKVENDLDQVNIFLQRRIVLQNGHILEYLKQICLKSYLFIEFFTIQG